MNTRTNLLLGLLACLAATAVSAAEMDHQQHPAPAEDTHQHMDHSQPAAPSAMDTMPMDHAQHGMHDQPAAMPQQGVLPPLDAMPASGKAREGGYDGRYVMESTGHALSAAERCAQASRGLLMLDNAGWADCGGKPQGAAHSGVAPAPPRSGDHSGHHAQ